MSCKRHNTMAVGERGRVRGREKEGYVQGDGNGAL